MGQKESENLIGVRKSVLKFTSDLCKILAKKHEKGYLCSSLSAHIALSMAAYGADKNTAKEMRQVLHLSNDDSELLEDYQKIIDVLNTDENAAPSQLYPTIDKETEDGIEEEQNEVSQEEREWLRERKLRDEQMQCIAKIASRIYISNNIKVQEPYEDALSTYFRSKSEILDFSRNPEESAKMINDWCHENTNGKISKIVESDAISDATALILINAVYFKGTWAQSFKTAVPKSFHLGMFKKVLVPTMKIQCEKNHEILPYRNLSELNARAVRLDFVNCKKHMEIIVPNRINGLKSIQKNLDKISNKEFKYANIKFWLPKFEVESVIEFKGYLKQMGMEEAFDEKDANFKKICDKELFIRTVLQKAYIKVDELGCEATAATSVGVAIKCCGRRRRRKPRFITIKANRPFLFRIMDSRLNIPLFIGTVVNPIRKSDDE